MQEGIEVKKIHAVYAIAIFLAATVASYAAQAAPTEPQASPPVHRNVQGCIDCLPPTSIPTLPQWCAIVMGLALIGLSLFLLRRSKTA
jgi:hypothetical protein